MSAKDQAAIGIERDDYLNPDHHKPAGRRKNDRKGKKRLGNGSQFVL